MMAGPKPHRLAYIDSLRGVAALLVMLMHNIQPIATGPVRTLLYDIVDPGKVGVVVFFAISGFVIPFSFPKGPAPLARFVVSRLFRLYPAYWLSMAAWIAVVAIIGGAMPSVINVLANVTMAQTLFGQTNLVGIYWTLFIELVFYTLCAVAFALGLLHIGRFTFGACLVWLLVAVLLAVARFTLERKVPVAVPLCLSIMFWGTLWREATINGSALDRRHATWILVLFAIAIPPISLLAYNFDTGLEEYWVRYAVSYYVAIGLFMLLSTRVRLTGRVAVWFGQISYSLYLFHVHTKLLVDEAVARAGLALPAALQVALSIAASVCVSYVVFTLVERPGIRIGKAVGGLIAARRSEQAGVPGAAQ
ncbi:acyltransferase family protein [Inquilinus sp. OTU3971]|uniref:acyltransferase family protein n=1 Tax=Inquilinus sp. OTU3971 TaxID=3043855 RepID=UPI00313C0713